MLRPEHCSHDSTEAFRIGGNSRSVHIVKHNASTGKAHFSGNIEFASFFGIRNFFSHANQTT